MPATVSAPPPPSIALPPLSDAARFPLRTAPASGGLRVLEDRRAPAQRSLFERRPSSPR